MLLHCFSNTTRQSIRTIFTFRKLISQPASIPLLMSRPGLFDGDIRIIKVLSDIECHQLWARMGLRDNERNSFFAQLLFTVCY